MFYNLKSIKWGMCMLLILIGIKTVLISYFNKVLLAAIKMDAVIITIIDEKTETQWVYKPY